MLPLPAQAAISVPDPAGTSGGAGSKSGKGPVKGTTAKNPPTAGGRWYSLANHFPVKTVVLLPVFHDIYLYLYLYISLSIYIYIDIS